MSCAAEWRRIGEDIMDFMKKLKQRFWLAIAYIVIGAALFIVCTFVKENDFLSPFGFAFVVMGIARLRNYFMITKNEETIKKQRIVENDERNIAIVQKAKSIAFGVYIIIASIAAVVLRLFNMTDMSKLIAYTVCAFVFIYWVSYFIIRKRY